MHMQKSGIIYPDPDKNEPVLEPAINNFDTGDVTNQAGLENDQLQNNEKSVVNNITNNYTVNRSGSDFGVRTYRDASAQQDNTKRILESLKKSPYGTSNQNSRKFSSGKDSDYGSSRKDNGGDTARDLLTVNQMDSRKFGSNKGQGSTDKSDNNDTARDLLTVSQINSKRSGKNMDVGKELKKLNEKGARIRKRRSVKEEKGESKFLNLMFIFEIFHWFSGSDIIVRFIIGAIAGIAGFGIIFTSMGLLDNL